MNHKQKNRNRNYKHRYGLSVEDVDRRVVAQGGLCAICGKKKRLNVDHNHTSGEVREMLCHLCNTVTGHLETHPAIVERAGEYLRRHNATHH